MQDYGAGTLNIPEGLGTGIAATYFPFCIEVTASWVFLWMLKIIDSISLVALVVLSANFLTSSATTAKPLPCSPALAASMAAFKARRFVWSAMSFITPMISPIFSGK